MLEFKNVSYRYALDDYDIVENLSFKVREGDFVSLIGISGCGKSTIFKLTNGILRKDKGRILIKGRDISDIKGVAAGYMPQKDMLFPWRTILDNISLPMEIAGVSAAKRRDKAMNMLSEVGLAGYADKYPKDLSGGMRQRISFARTVMTDAQLLLLDEPFSALDALTRMSMQEWLLNEFLHFKKTILFITHDVDEAIFMSDRILLIRGTPIHELCEVEVPLRYPRSRRDMDRPEILSLREYLLSELKRQVKI